MSARHGDKKLARTCNLQKGRDRYGNQQENQENYSETNGQETGSDETVGGAGRMESRKELSLNKKNALGGWLRMVPAPLHVCYDCTRLAAPVPLAQIIGSERPISSSLKK
jgi:hypothetical protein